MRLVVTRPLREALDWVERLGKAGLVAQALPLIDILPVVDEAGLQQAWSGLARYRAVMFVSANAVAGFFAARPPSAPSWPATRVWATGPGTVAALRRAGLSTGQIDAPAHDAGQFDSEALWQVVASQVRPDDCVLIVRGGDAQAVQNFQGVGRDWLAQRIAQAGAQVDFVVSYERAGAQLDAAQQALARAAATDGSLWLFSSSEAVRHLRAALPQQDWSAARALATHERIAAAAREAGFGQVRVSRPALPDVIASIESMT
ncbi:MAG: uroporphyrinogen-III synthase [Hylemonella sp.]|nr:uroporphyrinogen-III synthase [Hylemonella sp.]MDH5708915.1 uroporphyrinogen-III synthase [Hylemonella sp.]